MIQKSEKCTFEQSENGFLEFGAWDQLDIAYSHRTRRSYQFLMASVMFCVINFGKLLLFEKKVVFGQLIQI